MTEHVILNNEQHRDLRISTESSAEMGDAVMGCLTVPPEFRQVQNCFPIVFRRDPASGNFAAMALFGFTDGENLFLENGEWTARYKPVVQSVAPFLIGRPRQEGGEAQVHIDMAHPRVSSSGEGMRVFDEDGRPTPYMEDMARRLGMLHEAYKASGGFIDALRRHDLLEPFTLEVPLVDGSKHSLVGFHTIHEEKLEALDAAALGELQQAGYLLPIYMVLASMENFAEMIARKNRQVAGG